MSHLVKTGGEHAGCLAASQWVCVQPTPCFVFYVSLYRLWSLVVLTTSLPPSTATRLLPAGRTSSLHFSSPRYCTAVAEDLTPGAAVLAVSAAHAQGERRGAAGSVCQAGSDRALCSSCSRDLRV